MSPPPVGFGELLARVRAGDPAAAEDLVRRYEPVIRVTVRARLTDTRIRRVVETMDICQSVFAGFFVRAAVGEYDLNEPTDLIRLLVRMTHNKIASQYREDYRGKRDVRKTADMGEDGMEQVPGAFPPDRIAEAREQLENLRANLTPDERAVADGRAARKSWQEIADELGGTADGRRKQLTRAVTRVAPELADDLGCGDA